MKYNGPERRSIDRDTGYASLPLWKDLRKLHDSLFTRIRYLEAEVARLNRELKK